MIKRKKIAVFAVSWAAGILADYLSGLKEGFKDDYADIFLFTNYANIGDVDSINRLETNIYNLAKLEDYDAAIIFANSINIEGVVSELLYRCKVANIPTVCHGVDAPGTMDVICDSQKGFEELCSHLYYEHGVKHVMFLAGDENNADSNERLSLVRKFFEEHGSNMDHFEVEYTDWSYPTSVRIATAKAKAGNLPDAFICVNDIIAMSVIQALRDNGVRVPEDVIVTGFDNLRDGRIFYPSVATIDQHFDKMGEITAHMILDKLAGRRVEDRVHIDCTFIPSESCGCPIPQDSLTLRNTSNSNTFRVENDAIFFDGKLVQMGREMIKSFNFGQLRENITGLLLSRHDDEGESFFMCMHPSWFDNAESQKPLLSPKGYPKEFEVVFAMKNEKILDVKTTPVDVPVPGIVDNEANHIYMLFPIYDGVYTVGYLVFVDALHQLKNQITRKYRDKFCDSLDRYAQHLKMQHLNKQLSALANTDVLTNVKNRIAYEDSAAKINERLEKDPSYNYGIAMFDVNYLKKINDKYGHEYGDLYIRNCCSFICKAFKHSPVFRIGGDEFLALLENEDLKNAESIIKEMQAAMKEAAKSEDPENRISIACGLHVCNKFLNETVEEVFKHADANMYKNKRQMKAFGGVR